jgi:hypothetical protein
MKRIDNSWAGLAIGCPTATLIQQKPGKSSLVHVFSIKK